MKRSRTRVSRCSERTGDVESDENEAEEEEEADYLVVLVDREVWALRKVCFSFLFRYETRVRDESMRDERRRDDFVMIPQTRIKMMLKSKELDETKSFFYLS